MTQVLGIDISVNETQANLADPKSAHVPYDWVLARSHGIHVVTLRQMCAGAEDLQYRSNLADWTKLKPAVRLVTYQWLDLVRGTLLPQAKSWIAKMASPAGPHMLDLENWSTHTGWPGMISELGPCLDALDQFVGRSTWIYTNPSFTATNFLPSDVARLAGHPLVIAHWSQGAPLVLPPFTPLDVAGWQFTNQAFAAWYGVRNNTRQAALYKFDSTYFP